MMLSNDISVNIVILRIQLVIVCSGDRPGSSC